MNFTPLSREESCQMAYSLRGQSLILGILTVEILLSILTLIFLGLFVRNREIKKTWSIVGLDLKILCFIGFMVYILGSLNAILLHSYKLITLLLDFEPCFYVWKGVTCFGVNNFYSIICMLYFMWFHVGLLLERVYVCIYRKSTNGFLGVVLGSAIIILGPLIQFWVYDPNYVNRERPYCGNSVAAAPDKTNFIGSMLVFFDVFIAIGDYALYKWNKYQIKTLKLQKHGFDLNQSFALREMEISIKVIYPFALAHTATYFLQRIVTIYYSYFMPPNSTFAWTSFNSEMVNFSRIFTNFIVILFLYIYTRLRTSTQFRVHNGNLMDIHFRELQRMFNR